MTLPQHFGPTHGAVRLWERRGRVGLGEDWLLPPQMHVAGVFLGCSERNRAKPHLHPFLSLEHRFQNRAAGCQQLSAALQAKGNRAHIRCSLAVQENGPKQPTRGVAPGSPSAASRSLQAGESLPPSPSGLLAGRD